MMSEQRNKSQVNWMKRLKCGGICRFSFVGLSDKDCGLWNADCGFRIGELPKHYGNPKSEIFIKYKFRIPNNKKRPDIPGRSSFSCH